MSENQSEVVNFTIDGIAVTVPKGTTVYTAATNLGIDLPIFCYQDRMPPFGACRVCMVEVEKMAKPQTSCTLQATEGMVVKTQSTMAVDARKRILEFLLINHPLDCPICDRGGECPLQEQTLKFGPGQSRFYEEKRHFTKAKPLGPVLMLDRERCVVCARCTRFGEVIAGDHALQLLDRGYKSEVGTPGGGPAESKFIGNTIMICPVGALTSQVYRFRARPWDNEPTNSTCTLCPVGCSMILDSRDGEIMRTRTRINDDVNDIWMCDKGWFGYEFTSDPNRLQHPLVRKNGQLTPVSWDEALNLITTKIKHYKAAGKLAGLGGNPLTTEENDLFQQLMRQGAGVNHVDHRVGMPLFSKEEEGIAPGMEISIGACEKLSYAVLLGLDITEDFPVIWLRLRQAINQGAKVIFAGHYAPEISTYLEQTILHAPGKEIEIIRDQLSKFINPETKGAIFIGSQYLASPSRKAILAELLEIRQKNPNVSINILEGRGNSMGARIAGMRPDFGPQPGKNTQEILDTAAQSGWDFLYVAGTNLVKKIPSELWKQVRSKLGFLVVQELFLTETAQEADVVLPVLSFVEKGGSFVNIEQRVQRLLPGKEIPNAILSDAEIFTQIGMRLNLQLKNSPGLIQALQNEQIPLNRPSSLSNSRVAVNPGIQGKLRASFAHALFDEGVRMKHNPHVIQLTKSPRVRLKSSEGVQRGIKDGAEVQLSANNRKISAIVQYDDKVAEGTIVIPLGFDEITPYEWGVNLLNGLEIEIEMG